MKITIKILSLLLTVVILFTTLVSCFDPDSVNGDDDIDYTISDEKITEIVTEIIESLQKDNEKEENGDLPQKDNEKGGNGDLPQKDNEKGENGDLPQKDNEKEEIKDNSQGDNNKTEESWKYPEQSIFEILNFPIEYFAEELLYNELALNYEVFNGTIQLSDGSQYDGYAFLDYSEMYESQETGEIYFLTGFIPEQDSGFSLDSLKNEVIEIISEDDLDGYTYIYSYNCSNIDRHFVINDTYVKYGVDLTGNIYCETMPYIRGVCDETRGALYSYDTDKYVYDPYVGEYISITACSLSEILDYDAIEQEINDIIQNQDLKYVSTEVESAIYTSHDAMINYWMSLEEETFMGYSVNEIIEIAKTIDPMSCIEFTPDGYAFVNIAEAPPQEAGTFTRWVTGITCGIVIIAAVAAEAAGLPQQVGGAIIGASLEIFFQVVVDNKAFGEVDYRKVAVSAIAGAISAKVDFIADALIGGAENAAFTLIDGGSAKEVALSFIDGALCGLLLGALVKAAPKALKKLASKLPDGVLDAAKKVKTVVSDVVKDKLDNIAKKVGLDKIDDKIVKYKTARYTNKSLKQTYKIVLDSPSVEKARKGAKKLFTDFGFDWDKIQKLKSNPQALEEYLKSISIKGKNANVTTVKQLMALAQDSYLPTNNMSFNKFYSTSAQSAGDSAEWYLYLNAYEQGLNPRKEVVFDLIEYKGRKFNMFGYDEEITALNRKSDLVLDINGTETHVEIKVGKWGTNLRHKIRAELYADALRLNLFPDTKQQYKIFKNANNGLSMLDDPEQASYLLKMMEIFPDRVSVYLDDQLLSANDLVKYIKV